MKRCTYCGKEYPDEVAVCPLDQYPVTQHGNEIALPKKLRPDNREHLALRPSSVKFAVSLLTFSQVLDLALLIYRYQSHGDRTHDFYPLVTFTFGAVAVILYWVFRGKNWARWVVLCGIALGILLGPSMRIGPAHWRTYLFTCIDIVAAIALFLPSANEWYKGVKKVSPPVVA